jgi:hypothetical protein
MLGAVYQFTAMGWGSLHPFAFARALTVERDVMRRILTRIIRRERIAITTFLSLMLVLPGYFYYLSICGICSSREAIVTIDALLNPATGPAPTLGAPLLGREEVGKSGFGELRSPNPLFPYFLFQ